jgi:hypothetical protein
MPEEQKQKPLKQFRLGALSVAVWERRNDKGDVWFTATPQRAYKNQAEEWDYTTSFDANDLPVVAALMNQAFSFIVATEAAHAAAKA